MNRAVIFDMNGVIVEDERFHQESWRVLSKKHGIQLSEEEFQHKIFGRRETDTLEYMFRRPISPSEMQQFLDERVAIAIELVGANLAPTEGVVEFIRSLHEQSIPLAVATSSRKPYTSFILDGLDLRKYFQAVITAEDVTKGKPDPEIYLKAAESLAVEANLCVAIEDSLSGIRSAKAAGMKVIGIATTHSEKELETADRVIHNFREITLKDIEHIRETRSSTRESY